MRSKHLFFLLAILFWAGCGQFSSVGREESPAPGTAAESKAAAPPAEGQSTADTVHASTLEPAEITQKIIRNASLRIEVEDYTRSHERILQLTEESAGYVAVENENRRQNIIENRMTIRVPAERLDPMLKDIQQIALYVHSKNITATDVTEEFVDLEARLRTKREVAERYSEILRQARNVPEILQVEAELRKVREEIESAEGRLRYLSHRVAFSTVDLTVYQELETDSPPGRDFLSLIMDALAGGWEGLRWVIIGLVYLWPLWLVILIVCWLIVRLIRRRRKVKAAA
jgi:hypothetical protein